MKKIFSTLAFLIFASAVWGGTNNTVPKFNNAAGTKIGNSRITDNGTVVGISTSPVSGSTLTVNGRIESLVGGVKFPDGTIQTTAATGSVSEGQPLVGATANNANMYTDGTGDITTNAGWGFIFTAGLPATYQAWLGPDSTFDTGVDFQIYDPNGSTIQLGDDAGASTQGFLFDVAGVDSAGLKFNNSTGFLFDIPNNSNLLTIGGSAMTLAANYDFIMSGTGDMTLPNAGPSAPNIHTPGAATTGLYFSGGALMYAAGGSKVTQVGNNGWTFMPGTVGNAAVQYEGISNTGIFFPGTTKVAMALGGTENGRFTSTGLKLGAASDPTFMLDVVGTANITGAVTLASTVTFSGITNVSAYVGTSGDVIGANDTVLSFTETKDTLSEFNGSTFTASMTGYYSACVGGILTGTASEAMSSAYVNLKNVSASTYVSMDGINGGVSVTQLYVSACNSNFPMTVGQILVPYAAINDVVGTDPGSIAQGWFTITRVP